MRRPAEQVIAAGRRRRRHALILRGGAAATAAVCAAAAVFAVTGLRGPGLRSAAVSAYTAAYVIGQVSTALASNDMVMQTSYTFSPAFPRVTQWSYGDRFSMTQSGYVPQPANPGVPRAQGNVSSAAGTALVNGSPAYVVVSYRLREWHRAAMRMIPAAGCSTRLDIVESGGPVDWPGYLRQALSCGEFRYAGQQNLHGKAAIELTGSMPGPSLWAQGPRPAGAAPQVSATLYVDPLTFVPVQVVWNNTGQSPAGQPAHGAIREDVRLLPPTPANVAKATLRIPAGFRKAPDAAFGGPVFRYLG
jgi:hypothetical protein